MVKILRGNFDGKLQQAGQSPGGSAGGDGRSDVDPVIPISLQREMDQIPGVCHLLDDNDSADGIPILTAIN